VHLVKLTSAVFAFSLIRAMAGKNAGGDKSPFDDGGLLLCRVSKLAESKPFSSPCRLGILLDTPAGDGGLRDNFESTLQLSYRGWPVAKDSKLHDASYNT
jgi:hypothetical protein